MRVLRSAFLFRTQLGLMLCKEHSTELFDICRHQLGVPSEGTVVPLAPAHPEPLPCLCTHSRCCEKRQPKPLTELNCQTGCLASAAIASVQCCTGVPARTASCPERQPKVHTERPLQVPSSLLWRSMSHHECGLPGSIFYS